MDIFINILGWVGSVEVLAAYGLNSYQKIKSDSVLFYVLNLTGGLLLIVYSVYKEAFPNAFINIVWVIIAGVALLKVRKK
jgi:hypothetical protein